MTDEWDQISHSLHDLYNQDPTIYINACKFLMRKSNSLIFREIVSNKLEDLLTLLAKNSELSDRETLLKFYNHEEYEAGLDFVSLEENSIEEDIQASEENIRFFSSNLLLHLANRYDSYFLSIFLPFAWKELFLSHTFHKKEVGIFLFNKLEPIMYDNDVTIHIFIARMLDFMNSPDLEIKITAATTLIKYIKHCVSFTDSQFLEPVFQNVLPFLLSQNNQIQDTGCLLILKLYYFFGEQLSHFTKQINVHVTQAYSSRPFGNSPRLDQVRALCRRYPPKIH